MKKTFPAPAAFNAEPRPPIELKPVVSGQVAAIGYDDDTQTLAVQFTRGLRAVYHYPNVNRATYEAFIGAESIGTYFGHHIKALPFKKYPAESAAVVPA